MNDYVYRYYFDAIHDRLRPVTMVDHKSKHRDFKIRIQDEQLLTRRHLESSIPSLVADLIDLGVAVYTADRLSYRHLDTHNVIHIELPVRNPDILTSPAIHDLLQVTLRWYTEDDWIFEFPLRQDEGRQAETQRRLPLFKPQYPVEVALWSGGLDSFAGACNRLSNAQEKRLTLFGTGGNDYINHLQQDLAIRMESIFPGRIKVINIPIRSSGTKNIKKNSLCRARGFVFLLLGAACALLEGQRNLYLYENGVGAINLPYRASEVGIAHSRAVHPTSLVMMSKLISTILGEHFDFHNPFIFQTKAQMCRVLSTIPSLWLHHNTVSCDSMHRKKGNPRQCGYCTSCLLRRQALAAAHIIDPTRYAIVNTFRKTGVVDDAKSEHLRSMLLQAQRLRECLNTSNPWYSIAAIYPEYLPGVVDALAGAENISREIIVENLLDMYTRYVNEWDAVRSLLQQGLLTDEMYQAIVYGLAA